MANVNFPPPPPPPATRLPGPFSQAAETMSASRELVIRVLNVTDRLCGPGSSVEAASGSAEKLPEGVFASMTSDAAATRSFIKDAHAALDRIESALP